MAIATAIPSPPTTVRPGYLTSMRTPSLTSSEEMPFVMEGMRKGVRGTGATVRRRTYPFDRGIRHPAAAGCRAMGRSRYRFGPSFPAACLVDGSVHERPEQLTTPGVHGRRRLQPVEVAGHVTDEQSAVRQDPR